MPVLVVASDNKGKLREFRKLLLPLNFEVKAQGEFGVQSAPEPHDTFVENALAKARHASRATGLPALADDSGLCCSALLGAPGVRSARLAGPDASDAENNAELIARLKNQTDRRAHYTCVLVALRYAEDSEPIIASAHWHGEIVDEPLGENGFGYDPFFWLPSLRMTAAQLSPEHKNQISHRALAMAELCRKIQLLWA